MRGGDLVGSCRLREQHRITHGADVGLERFEFATRTVDGVHDNSLRSADERTLNTN
jgi:hypothetical protein